ncbi:hypothetical protein DOY81_001974, partial [Sarcophaga bullata]
ILRSQYMHLRNRPTTTTSKTITDSEDESSTDNENVYNKTHEMAISHHIETIDCSQSLSSSAVMGSSIKIHFDRIDQSLKNLNVIVEFTDMKNTPFSIKTVNIQTNSTNNADLL